MRKKIYNCVYVYFGMLSYLEQIKFIIYMYTKNKYFILELSHLSSTRQPYPFYNTAYRKRLCEMASLPVQYSEVDPRIPLNLVNFYLRRTIYEQQCAKFCRQWGRRRERVLRRTTTRDPGDPLAGEQPKSGSIVL